jgi:predicted ATPase
MDPNAKVLTPVAGAANRLTQNGILEVGDHHTLVSALTEQTSKRVVDSSATATKLYGRQKELERLLQAYGRVCRSNSRVVLIHGSAGTGKTSLAEGLRQPVSRQGGYYVSAKFHQNVQPGPFPAIVAALTDLCDLLAYRSKSNLSSPNKFLKKLGRADAQRLSQLFGTTNWFTSSGHAVNGNGEEDDTASVTSLSSVSSKKGLISSICKFLKVVASPKHPICLCLDDVQWADKASLQLLQVLLSDPESRHVMYCFVYRNDESSLQLLQALQASCILPASEVVVENLGPEAINKLIADRLKLDTTPATLSLAEVVLRKTHGHPLCVLQFLDLLQADGLLELQQDNTWVWDLKRIQTETDVTENVAELVTQKVQRTHRYVQLILKVAAAIGLEFDRQILEAVIVSECMAVLKNKKEKIDLQQYERKIDKYLTVALHESLIEKTGYSGKYKFTHERVREAVYHLIPEGDERVDLHYRIGHCLKALLLHELEVNHQQPDWMVFGLANQLNRAIPKLTTAKERVDMIRINIEAAKLAKIKGAFVAAVEYLRMSQDLLDVNTLLTMYYDAGKQLYNLLAEMKYAIGDFVGCEAAARVVFQYGKTAADTLDCFRSLVDALDAQGKGEEALEVALDYMKECGEPQFPSKPKATAVMMELLRIQKLTQSLSDEELINLPLTRDPKVLDKLNLVSVFGTMTPMVGSHELIALLSVLRVVELSVEHGVAPISTYGFASFGMALAKLGHPHEAFRFGNVSLEMLKRFNTPANLQAHTLAVVHSACMHWRCPIQDSLAPLMLAYEEGMVAGDVKFSFLAAHNYLLATLETGVALPQVEVDMRVFCEGLDDMCSHNAVRTLVVPMWQMVLNFMGKSDDPLTLTGSAMEEDVFLQDPDILKFVGGLLVYYKAKMALAYHFDSFKLVENLTEQLDREEQDVYWHFSCYQVRLYSCLAYLHLSESTGKRKYRVKAVKVLKKLEVLLQDGNVNCRAFVLLLQAEYLALTDPQLSVNQLKKLFDQAISDATRLSNHLHLAALANERAGMACFRAQDFGAGTQYILQARELYRKWGALAKVSYMERKYHMMLRHPIPQESAISDKVANEASVTGGEE